LPAQLKGWRHLFAAVLALATGSGPVEERLRLAYWEHLRLLDPAQSLPDDLRAEFERIRGELAHLFPQREARVPEKWVQSSDLAERIVRLYIAYVRR
jgi:hypothetical protein